MPSHIILNLLKMLFIFLDVNFFRNLIIFILLLILLTAFFASRVIGVFEGTIERVVALATLMPIIAGVAGNSGNQTLVLMIRSIALGHITSLSISRLFIKELSVAFINGIIWGAVAGLFAYWLYFDQPISMLLGLTMMLAILLNLTVAAAFGVLIPVILNKLNKDPAVGSSVLLTFGTDSMGFLIFLGLLLHSLVKIHIGIFFFFSSVVRV